MKKGDILRIDRKAFSELAAKRKFGYGTCSLECSGETFVKEASGGSILLTCISGCFDTWTTEDDLLSVGAKVVGTCKRGWFGTVKSKTYKGND